VPASLCLPGHLGHSACVPPGLVWPRETRGDRRVALADRLDPRPARCRVCPLPPGRPAGQLRALGPPASLGLPHCPSRLPARLLCWVSPPPAPDQSGRTPAASVGQLGQLGCAWVAWGAFGCFGWLLRTRGPGRRVPCPPPPTLVRRWAPAPFFPPPGRPDIAPLKKKKTTKKKKKKKATDLATSSSSDPRGRLLPSTGLLTTSPRTSVSPGKKGSPPCALAHRSRFEAALPPVMDSRVARAVAVSSICLACRLGRRDPRPPTSFCPH